MKMQLRSKLIEQFNSPDTILVISKYPYKDISQSYHGVAHYTQRTLRAVVQQTKKKFVVLVQCEYGREVSFDAKNNILIVPCFDDSLNMFTQLLKTIQQFNHCTLVHIHSEFYTSGNILQMGLVIPFLLILKMFGKDVRYIAHNVVTDLSFLARHLGKSQNDLLLTGAEKLIPIYYFLLSLGVSQLVVLDESVKQKLLSFFPKNKILLSPHWVQPHRFSLKNQGKIKRKLKIKTGEKVLLCFGFMTRYKGVDWLIKAVHHLNAVQEKRIHLILAGGKAPSQTGKKHYELFYAELSKHAAQNPYIHLTGFLPDSEIGEYFNLADLVVLPYRGILGASGSWAEAMKYHKPFILSKDLLPYLHSNDVTQIINKLKIKEKDVIFTRNKGSFAQKVLTTLQKPAIDVLTNMSREIALHRLPHKQIKRELSILFTPQQSDSVLTSFMQQYSFSRLHIDRFLAALR